MIAAVVSGCGFSGTSSDLFGDFLIDDFSAETISLYSDAAGVSSKAQIVSGEPSILNGHIGTGGVRRALNVSSGEGAPGTGVDINDTIPGSLYIYHGTPGKGNSRGSVEWMPDGVFDTVDLTPLGSETEIHIGYEILGGGTVDYFRLGLFNFPLITNSIGSLSGSGVAVFQLSSFSANPVDFDSVGRIQFSSVAPSGTKVRVDYINVTGAVVPEPSSFVGLASGLLALSRKRKACKEILE